MDVVSQPASSDDTKTIRVKFTAKGHAAKDRDVFLRQFPRREPVWGRCEFTFDPDDRNYDWLVAYDDLAPVGEERFSTRAESLDCPPQNTLFVTMEPSSIKTYGFDFLNQFGAILTSQESWAIPHPQTIRSQPALVWFYGRFPGAYIDYDEMVSSPPLVKQRQVGTVCSSKQQKNTVHHLRYEFTHRLASQFPELDVFGRGVRPIDDKADSLDLYRYHLAIENHICDHHWTEKLSDAFLGATLPFYYGCPNARDYFPEDSFIAIDCRDFDGALETIQSAVANNEFEQRLDAILEARQRVLDQYNLFAVLAREIELRHGRHEFLGRSAREGMLFSRHQMRSRSFGHVLRFARDRWKANRMLAKQRRAA